MCSLGSASSRLGIDRLCPRGPHGDSAFVQTRASPSALAFNMAPVGGHVACHPLTDIAPPPTQRRPSVRTRPPQGIYDAATNPSLSLFPFLSPFRPPPLSLSLFLSVLVFPLHPVLSLCLPTSLIPTGSVSISSCILLFRDGLNICTAR